jgi:hypothetical protein
MVAVILMWLIAVVFGEFNLAWLVAGLGIMVLLLTLGFFLERISTRFNEWVEKTFGNHRGTFD